MGKLMGRLKKQLKTEYKSDAKDCIKIYDALHKETGHVWDTEWRVLVTTIYKGFPSDERRFEPTKIGRIFLKGIDRLTDEA